MTANLAKWVSNNGKIIKSGLSDGRRAKFLPSVVESSTIGYELEGIWEMSDSTAYEVSGRAS